MEDNNNAGEESLPQGVTSEVVTEVPKVETPSESESEPLPVPLPQKTEKTVPYERFKMVNDQLNKLKNEKPKVINAALEVDDFIDISASLEGLDQKEKERLAYEHKLTGKPLKEIRQDEDFQLWQSAHRQKVAKEQSALAPTSTQTEETAQQSLDARLATASMAEKEKILIDLGLMKSPRPKGERPHIGTGNY